MSELPTDTQEILRVARLEVIGIASDALECYTRIGHLYERLDALVKNLRPVNPAGFEPQSHFREAIAQLMKANERLKEELFDMQDDDSEIEESNEHRPSDHAAGGTQ